MAVLEGKWGCAQCPTVGISGLLLKCPNCGDPRNQHLDPEEAPYLPTDAREITDQDELDYANSGPAWNCGKCGELNRGDHDTCSNCGAKRDHDDMVNPVYTYVDGIDAQNVHLDNPGAVVDDRTDAVLKSADKLQELETEPVTMPARTFSALSIPRRSVLSLRDAAYRGRRALSSRVRVSPAKAALTAAATVLSVGGGGAVYVNFVQTHDVTLQVTGLAWERQVEVEELRTLTKQDWDPPADARIQHSERAIHHYDTVLDHYETRPHQVGEQVQTGTRNESYACGSTTVDNGNGTFSTETEYCDRSVPVYTTEYHTEYSQEPVYRQDPVYRTLYTYEIDRWMTDTFVTAKGSSEPHWPEPRDLSSKQRVGDERRETYTVTLSDEDGRSFNREIDWSKWSVLDSGETIPGKENHQGSLRSVEWPTS